MNAGDDVKHRDRVPTPVLTSIEHEEIAEIVYKIWSSRKSCFMNTGYMIMLETANERTCSCSKPLFAIHVVE